MQREVFRRGDQLGVVAEGILRLGDAHRQLAVAHGGQLVQRFLRRGAVGNIARMVDLFGDGLDLLRQRGVQLVGVAQFGAVVQNREHGLGQGLAAFAAFGEHLGQRAGHARLAADFVNDVHLLRRIGGEGVDRHAHRQPKALQVADMALQVDRAGLYGRGVGLAERGFGHAAVRFQRAHRGDQHDGRRVQAGVAALDVQELFRAQVGAEAGLGHDVIGQFQAQAGRQHAVAAVGDVGKRPAVDDGGVVFQRLDEVGVDGVLQQSGHSAGRAQLPGCDGLAAVGVGADDAG